MIKYLYLGKKFIFLILGVDPRVLCMLSMFWTTELLIEPLTLTPSLYQLVLLMFSYSWIILHSLLQIHSFICTKSSRNGLGSNKLLIFYGQIKLKDRYHGDEFGATWGSWSFIWPWLSLATCNILSQLPFSVPIVGFIFHPLKRSSVHQETEVTLLLARNTQGDQGTYLATLSH